MHPTLAHPTLAPAPSGAFSRRVGRRRREDVAIAVGPRHPRPLPERGAEGDGVTVPGRSRGPDPGRRPVLLACSGVPRSCLYDCTGVANLHSGPGRRQPPERAPPGRSPTAALALRSRLFELVIGQPALVWVGGDRKGTRLN